MPAEEKNQVYPESGVTSDFPLPSTQLQCGRSRCAMNTIGDTSVLVYTRVNTVEGGVRIC